MEVILITFSNLECEWIIVVPGGERIRVDFTEKFELERANQNRSA